MNKTIKILGGISLFLVYTAGVVYWFEAEKEVRILCSMFQEAQAADRVLQTLDTGNLLSYSQDSEAIAVNSFYTLNSTKCIVRLSDEATVTESVYRQSFRVEKVAGVVAAVLTFGLSVFQLLLALGLPWGRWAWGGRYTILPKSLRIGSLVSFLLLSLGGLSVLSATHFITLIPEPIYRIVVATLTLIFLGSIVGNLKSRSKKERQVMIPLSILLFCSYLVIVVYMFG